jgi:phage-related protein
LAYPCNRGPCQVNFTPGGAQQPRLFSLQGFYYGFQSFEEQARNSTGGIGTSIQVAKTQVVKGVADVITSLNKGLQDANLPSISEIIATIGKKAKEVLDVVADKLPAIISFLKTIAPILTPILAAVMAFKVVGTIISLINAAKTAMIALNVALAANPIGLVIAAIVGLVAAFAILWNKSEAFRNFWKGLWEVIKNIIKVAIDIVVNRIRGFAAKIIAIFNIASKVYGIGKNIVFGLWNGISGSLNWIKNKISGWVGNVLNFIKKLFGIHSPSTVMRDEVGKYLAQGMGVGFDKELGNVYDDMQRAIDLETSKMSANVQTSGTYQLAMAGNPTFNLRDNSTHQTDLVVNGKVLAEVVNTENRNREVARA